MKGLSPEHMIDLLKEDITRKQKQICYHILKYDVIWIRNVKKRKWEPRLNIHNQALVEAYAQ